jgi:hypothetical protein
LKAINYFICAWVLNKTYFLDIYDGSLGIAVDWLDLLGVLGHGECLIDLVGFVVAMNCCDLCLWTFNKARAFVSKPLAVGLSSPTGITTITIREA